MPKALYGQAEDGSYRKEVKEVPACLAVIQQCETAQKMAKLYESLLITERNPSYRSTYYRLREQWLKREAGFSARLSALRRRETAACRG